MCMHTNMPQKKSYPPIPLWGFLAVVVCERGAAGHSLPHTHVDLPMCDSVSASGIDRPQGESIDPVMEKVEEGEMMNPAEIAKTEKGDFKLVLPLLCFIAIVT
eukprot:GHVO01068942.1.p1 GENE.GHVO01068942.1~~GHVO01068942.1.p1  ORF type:complete len:103 (-),score=24.41 GHVO01068942.1:79-387(-)